MKMQSTILLVLMVFSFGTVAAPPKPQKSDYFESSGGGFNLEGNQLSYSLNVNVLKVIQNGNKLVVEFQNPQNKKQPLSQEHEVIPGQKEYRFSSGTLACINNGKTYKVTVKIVDISSGKVVSRHNQKLKFELPDFLLKDRKIKSC